jgi:hypothetical protein
MKKYIPVTTRGGSLETEDPALSRPVFPNLLNAADPLQRMLIYRGAHTIQDGNLFIFYIS